jgi:hypothetical protein
MDRRYFTRRDLYDAGVLDARYYPRGELDTEVASLLLEYAKFVTPWTNLTFASGWGNYGFGFRTGQYQKVGDLVFVRGVVARSSGSSDTMATLPVGHRPTQQEPFAVDSANAHGRVDITTDGDLALLIGTATDYVSLNGIVFSVL